MQFRITFRLLRLCAAAESLLCTGGRVTVSLLCLFWSVVLVACVGEKQKSHLIFPYIGRMADSEWDLPLISVPVNLLLSPANLRTLRQERDKFRMVTSLIFCTSHPPSARGATESEQELPIIPVPASLLLSTAGLGTYARSAAD